MTSSAAGLSRQLAANAEAVCRHYLSNGRKQGHYWLVGDVRNTAGRSMFVRLSGPANGTRAAGKWTDAATSEAWGPARCHPRKLRIGRIQGRRRRGPTLLEPAVARPGSTAVYRVTATRFHRSQDAARRLFAMGVRLRGTPAETYLRGRGNQRFRPDAKPAFPSRLLLLAEGGGPVSRLPAMLAAITISMAGNGTHRTWLRPDGRPRPISTTPRRAMGALLGNGDGFGAPVTCSSRARGSRRGSFRALGLPKSRPRGAVVGAPGGHPVSHRTAAAIRVARP